MALAGSSCTFSFRASCCSCSVLVLLGTKGLRTDAFKRIVSINGGLITEASEQEGREPTGSRPSTFSGSRRPSRAVRTLDIVADHVQDHVPAHSLHAAAFEYGNLAACRLAVLGFSVRSSSFWEIALFSFADALSGFDLFHMVLYSFLHGLERVDRMPAFPSRFVN